MPPTDRRETKGERDLRLGEKWVNPNPSSVSPGPPTPPPEWADGERPVWIRAPGWQLPIPLPMPIDLPAQPPEPPTADYIERLRRRPSFLLTAMERRALAAAGNG